MAEFSGDAAAAARWTQGVLGAAAARLAGRARAGRRRAEASSCSTAARATRSGNTCSARGRRCDEPARDERAARPRRPQPRRARALLARRRRSPAACARRTRVPTSPRGRWLLNPGSVGQPRDGDPRAAWLLIDTDAAPGRVPPRGRIRSSRRRQRSASAGCRPRWRHDSLTGSDVRLRLVACAGTRCVLAGRLRRTAGSRRSQHGGRLTADRADRPRSPAEGPCAPGARHPAVSARAIQLVNQGRVPAELQEPLLAGVNALAAARTPACVPPAPAPRPGRRRRRRDDTRPQGHGKARKARARRDEQREPIPDRTELGRGGMAVVYAA